MSPLRVAASGASSPAARRRWSARETRTTRAGRLSLARRQRTGGCRRARRLRATSRSTVWAARCRLHDQHVDRHERDRGGHGEPRASSVMPEQHEQSSQAGRDRRGEGERVLLTATARSIPMTVPMKPQIIRNACASDRRARPRRRTALEARPAPARIRPPAMPATQAARHDDGEHKPHREVEAGAVDTSLALHGRLSVALPAHEGLGSSAHAIGGPRRLPDQFDVDPHVGRLRRGPARHRRRRR